MARPRIDVLVISSVKPAMGLAPPAAMAPTRTASIRSALRRCVSRRIAMAAAMKAPLVETEATQSGTDPQSIPASRPAYPCGDDGKSGRRGLSSRQGVSTGGECELNHRAATDHRPIAVRGSTLMCA